MLQRRSYAIGLVAAVLFGQFAVAQTNVGQIAGRVTDSTGSVVPGCTVTSTNTGTGFVLTTKTDNSGDYIFPSLPPATFTIRAEAAGFRPSVQNGVILDAASKRTVNFDLQVGTLQESVEVTASAQQVQTASGEVSKVIFDKQLADIALNGRNYSQMLRLVPGSVSLTLDSFNVGLSTTAQSINGVHSNQNYFSVDGAENMDNGSNSNSIINPSMDAIAEIRTLTSSYSAEFGGRAGASVNVVTKSGTRDFHGTLYEFVRNDMFDARSFFSSVVPPLRFNDFGWTLGGPIIFPGTAFNKSRSKLFFFAAQEWKYSHPGATNVGTVPTALERQGNFQGSTLPVPKDPTSKQPFPNAVVRLSTAELRRSRRQLHDIGRKPDR
jgi:Carboxypeptidase regulatory-like domain/TonB-dependent Receptor Plug Domain